MFDLTRKLACFSPNNGGNISYFKYFCNYHSTLLPKIEVIIPCRSPLNRSKGCFVLVSYGIFGWLVWVNFVVFFS